MYFYSFETYAFDFIRDFSNDSIVTGAHRTTISSAESKSHDSWKCCVRFTRFNVNNPEMTRVGRGGVLCQLSALLHRYKYQATRNLNTELHLEFYFLIYCVSGASALHGQ